MIFSFQKILRCLKISLAEPVIYAYTVGSSKGWYEFLVLWGYYLFYGVLSNRSLILGSLVAYLFLI